jgi:hypothetical protein
MEYYDSAASSTTRRTKDLRGNNNNNNNNNNNLIRSIRIEIDEVVLEGFNPKQIDDEKLAANIIANLLQLVQNNANSMSDLAFETKANSNDNTDSKITFPIGNAIGERNSHISKVDAGTFVLGSSKEINSNNVGQNVGISIFRGLSSLMAIKE